MGAADVTIARCRVGSDGARRPSSPPDGIQHWNAMDVSMEPFDSVAQTKECEKRAPVGRGTRPPTYQRWACCASQTNRLG